jgi:hypothetical protein
LRDTVREAIAGGAVRDHNGPAMERRVDGRSDAPQVDLKEPAMGRRKEPPPPPPAIEPDVVDDSRVIERADGFYWQSADGAAEYGPFRTYAQAVEEMEAAEVDVNDETLEEAEAEIGVSGWIDPETGDFGDSWAPRLEDH